MQEVTLLYDIGRLYTPYTTWLYTPYTLLYDMTWLYTPYRFEISFHRDHGKQ